jgi:hypothetical protein
MESRTAPSRNDDFYLLRTGFEKARNFAYASRYEARDNVLLYPAPKEYDASHRGKSSTIRIETIDFNCDLAKNRPIILQQMKAILRLNEFSEGGTS